MENGASIAIESSWALNTLQVDEAKTVLCGTEAGADMLDGLRINGEEFGKTYVKNIEVPGKGVVFDEATHQLWGPGLEMRMWLDAVVNDTEVVVKPEQALVVSEIVEAIYESAVTGKPYLF
jgi:predicted dehydrogenase